VLTLYVALIIPKDGYPDRYPLLFISTIISFPGIASRLMIVVISLFEIKKPLMKMKGYTIE
jgi:hypothetical protein